MRTFRTVAELRAQLALERHPDRKIGLVPTMGAFHDGHRSLMRDARRSCDYVVVSLFVNPTQFGANEDLSAYPRDEERDAQIAEQEGVDVLFAPHAQEVYPDGFATTVHVAGPAVGLEGAHRPGHFDGVATVVAKLLNMAQPDIAFFGQKDAQQAAVIRQLVRDLNMPVRIEVRPTVREPDGLAMSSRNAYLEPAERERAIALRKALDATEHAAAAGERDAQALEEAARAALSAYAIEPEYVALVHADTLVPITRLDTTDRVLVAVAARVGRARLIDNTVIDPRALGD